ncbi:hypothetical protein M758_4G127100 [Ceratodon purpureus]|uniref:Uncharacterized protein n=1 Tax=Ceratodon purpureus TaxID=3225 RepID=A0A8T0I819_CERPU|nr:hypothetical protein KC19_4G125900 [Ceratodon purpureus]KAG0619264.1 hypothetical protein M758_4G127100 [Ceratodon purpureus]
MSHRLLWSPIGCMLLLGRTIHKTCRVGPKAQACDVTAARREVLHCCNFG